MMCLSIGLLTRSLPSIVCNKARICLQKPQRAFSFTRHAISMGHVLRVVRIVVSAEQ